MVFDVPNIALINNETKFQTTFSIVVPHLFIINIV